MLTLTDVRDAAALLNPENVNPGTDDGGCRYTEDDGTPSCMVGNILSILDIARPGINSTHNESGFLSVVEAYDLADLLDGEAIQWLANAQGVADNGYTWGRAIAAAEAAR